MYSIKEILKSLVVPALGCTEIVAIALCASYASSLVKEEDIDHVELFLSPDVFKNASGVIIPRTNGLKGPAIACALGIFGGDPHLKMEVLSSLNSVSVKKALMFVEMGKVKVRLKEKIRGLYVEVKIFARENTSEALIKDYQDELARLRLNEEDRIQSMNSGRKSLKTSIMKWIKNKTFEDLKELVESVDKDDLLYVKEGVKRNLILAEYGLNNGSGMGVGLLLKRSMEKGFLKDDPLLWARILTASAADARMSGVDIPATSSAGSGNNGLVATIPVWIIGKGRGIEEEKILKAIVLSHLITAKVKSYLGQLSFMCSCSIAAGAGASAGITYLMGGSLKHIKGCVSSLIEDLTGVVCDGAKPSCALKLATAVDSAYTNSLFALYGKAVLLKEGIVGKDIEETLSNLEVISQVSSETVDGAVLSILLKD